MIHKFYMDGMHVVMDIHSGAVHIVDDVVFDIVEAAEHKSREELVAAFSDKHEEEKLLEAMDEIEALRKAELLYTEDIYENIVPKVDARGPVVKALCLHVAHDCNLKCEYCFAEEGEYHGHRSLMSVEVGKAALDFLIAHSGARRNLEVDFFGGEPLMNFDVVKELVAYGESIEKAHGKKFRFTITTNGILLNDETEAFINEHMHNVVLSLDGRREVNDRVRPRAGGQGSYDVIVPKFQKLAKSRGQKDYYVRGTFTKYNLDFYEDVMHLAELGFDQVSVEPVVTADEVPYALSEKELPVIFAEYERLAKELAARRTGESEKKDFNFFHFNIDLTGGPCIYKRLAGCGSGTEYLAVTPEGDLYPCHQFVGMEEFKMGTVWEGVTDTGRREEFSKCNIYRKDDCKACFAKFYCSGGCAANAYQENGDILKPYALGCEMQKKRVECAIMLKARQMCAEQE